MKFNIKGSDYCSPLCPFLEIDKTITEWENLILADMSCRYKKTCQFIGDTAINQYKRIQEETECI